MSATTLAEYLILRPSGQQNILHDSKYTRPPIITANGEAMRALRAYNQDPKRSKDTLLRVKAALTMKAASIGIKPKARDEALRCAEIIDLFQRQENALGMRTMALSAAPDFDAIEIEGVMVSIQPDFLIGGVGLIGAAMLRVAKAPDPASCKSDEGKDRRGNVRRELARYLVAEMQLVLEAQTGNSALPTGTFASWPMSASANALVRHRITLLGFAISAVRVSRSVNCGHLSSQSHLS
jgi:hypothetical protein